MKSPPLRCDAARKGVKLNGLVVLRKVSEEPNKEMSVSCGSTSSTTDFSTAANNKLQLSTVVSTEVIPAYGKIFLMESPT